MTRILAVSGSLRAESTNTAALRTAREVAPDGVEVVLYDGVAGLPQFNPDDDTPERLPPTVAALRTGVHDADALLLSVPEYAGALPGSFKNVLDWLIGDDQPRSIYEKPAGWINPSARGAGGAYQELRTVLGYAHAEIVEAACVLAEAGDREMIATAVDALVTRARARRR
jgi:NAD(P)H-dependent FMN reductase